MSETIYSLVPHVPDVPVKPPMYKSRHDPVCVLAGSTFGEGSVDKRVRKKKYTLMEWQAPSLSAKSDAIRLRVLLAGCTPLNCVCSQSAQMHVVLWRETRKCALSAGFVC